MACFNAWTNDGRRSILRHHATADAYSKIMSPKDKATTPFLVMQHPPRC